MGYFAAFLVVLLGLLSPKSRITTAIMSTYIWCIIALNTVSADYYAYEEMYRCAFEPRYGHHEPLFMLLCKICLSLGLSFTQFRMIVAAIVVVLIVKAISALTDYRNYALALFILFPLAPLVSGLRSTLGFSVAIYCIAKYLLSKESTALNKYIIGIFAAMLCHYSCCFFFIFILSRGKNKKISNSIVVAAFCFCAALFLGYSGLLLNLMTMVTSSPKIIYWFSPEKLGFSPNYLIVIFAMSIIMLLLLLSRNREIRREQGNSKAECNSDMISQAMLICAYSMISLTGAIFSSVVFLRLLIPSVVISYCILAETLAPWTDDSKTVWKEKTATYFGLPLIVTVFTIYIFSTWIGGDMLSTFQNNMLFV